MNESVRLITRLNFGEGQIAKEAVFNERELLPMLQRYTLPITVSNTADCVDGRSILGFADGNQDLDVIKGRVTHQLPGGLVLSVTKAAVAADLAVVRDSRTFKGAYTTMYDLVTSLGFADGGHADCGASKKLIETVSSEVPLDKLVPTVGVIRPLNRDALAIAKLNIDSKKQKLDQGFYDDWDNKWHEQFLAAHSPQNFAILRSDSTPLNGHYEKGLYLINKPGYGLAKNEFIEASGDMVFCETTHSSLSIVSSIGDKIHSSPLERKRFLFEFDAYGPNVLNKLAAKGLAVFGQ